jgi:hypothetical protein
MVEAENAKTETAPPPQPETESKSEDVGTDSIVEEEAEVKTKPEIGDSGAAADAAVVETSGIEEVGTSSAATGKKRGRDEAEDGEGGEGGLPQAKRVDSKTEEMEGDGKGSIES